MSGHEGSLNTGSDHDAANKQSNSNPFDDYDFSQVQKRRERAKQAKEDAKDDAEKSLLANADADTMVAPINLETGKKVRRHNIIRASNKPYDGGVKERKKTANFFGFGQQMTGDSDTANYEDSVIDLTPINVGNKTLAVWPYDDFHLIQKAYYEKLGESKEQLSTHEEEDAAAAEDDQANTMGGATTKEKEQRQRQQHQQMIEQQSSIPIFSRPPDPPDIPSAVQGLSLTRFEYKAEERAIAIVSTWLFDVGLIDELLVNGGMTGLTEAHYADDSASVRTSEGVEITSLGNPIEGSTKMDKEITKLRNATKRQLALINARLNDGVAATGSEVQELVSAVAATKDDISRLRELSSYVSNAGDVEQTDQFMLTKYPKLKQAINARRNLARCFRELDFFAQIPSTCDRLREELHAGEWTAHEWSSLRSVAREHVELEIFLVEAERGMKKRLEGEGEQSKQSKPSRRQSDDANFGRNAFRNSGINNSNALIDRFLEEHVSNVWELGDEIRLRIMSGIASSFDLALNNPAGMVALVEAVEVYETANDDYSAVHGEEAGQDSHQSQTLRFTDMRAAALGELYKDFETRGLDVFRELTTAAADTADEDDVSNKQFSAVLRASNELAAEIGIVKDQMSVCFPDNWSITTLWTTCVAHVCSTNILQQIGGADGQKLPDLTVTQLLDLVAWVENFREIIEDTFPEIAKMQAKRTYLNQSPRLLQENSKTIDLDAAQDSLAWVNNTLWEVHDLAKDEFLLRTKEQTEGWLRNVYEYVSFWPCVHLAAFSRFAFAAELITITNPKPPTVALLHPFVRTSIHSLVCSFARFGSA
jgi:Exocyst complex component Sec6